MAMVHISDLLTARRATVVLLEDIEKANVDEPDEEPDFDPEDDDEEFL